MNMNSQFWPLEHDCRCDKEELFYWDKTKKWVTRREYINNGGSWFPSGFPCRSYKAAIRHLKKHDEIPKGTRFVLISKYAHFNRYLVKR